MGFVTVIIIYYVMFTIDGLSWWNFTSLLTGNDSTEILILNLCNGNLKQAVINKCQRYVSVWL